MHPADPEPFWFRAGGAWALGVGLDLTSHSPRCFRMVWMTSRSSMKLMIRMIPRHFGQAPLNSEGLFRPPIKHFLLNHGQVTLSGRYYSTGQVRGSTFPDQVGDRLRPSGSAGPSSSGIPLNFYRIQGCMGPRPLWFLSVFPGRSRETRDCSNHSIVSTQL